MMKDIGKLANRETVCVLTNMNEPVGHAVGNTLEIIETHSCRQAIEEALNSCMILIP